MPDKTRFEREIDEILEKSGDEKKPRRSRGRQFEPFSPKVPKRRPPVKPGGVRFNPSTLIILGLVVLAAAAFTPFAKLPLAVIGALLLTVGYVSWFRRGGGSSIPGRASRGRPDGRSTPGSTGDEPQVKYWRGRRIEEKPDTPDPDDRGKIIDFGPPDDERDRGDRGQDDS